MSATTEARAPRVTRRLWPAPAEHRPFLALLAFGFAMRVLMMIAQPSGALAYFDIPVYLITEPFGDPRVPGGYPLFTEGLQAIAADVTLLIAVQHLLGLLGACAVYWAALTAGLTRWPAALATAPALLAGEVLLLEHAPLTESLAIVFINLGLALMLVAVRRGAWAGALLAGAAFGLATTVRSIGLPLALTCIAWALVAVRGGWRPRLRVAGAAAVGVVVLIGGYLALASTGRYTGMGEVGGNYLYARVAQFADCRAFEPPPGTRGLCEARPSAERPGTLYYQFSPGNPKFVAFPETQTDYTANAKELRAFARAAILNQPLTYARTVLNDYSRFFERDVEARPQSGNGFEVITLGSARLPAASSVARQVQPQYPGTEAEAPRFGWGLRLYGGVTQIGGGVLAALFALAVIGAVLPSPSRWAGTLAMLVVLVLTLFPVATLIYSQRYFVPAYGALGLGAVIGGQALLLRARARRGAAGHPA